MAPKFDFKLWLKQSLPQEHGSWAFVAEPLLISWIMGGLHKGIAAAGFFLMFLGYRPAMIGIKDLLRHKAYSRTYPSFIVGGFLNALGGLLMLWAHAYVALGCLAIMGALFNWIDAKADKRSILREGFGTLLAVPPAILLAPMAGPLLVARPIASVLSVRGLIGRWDDSNRSRWQSVALGILLIPLGALAFPVASWRMVGYSTCVIRSLYAATRFGKPIKASHIGIAEMLVSISVVIGWLADAQHIHFPI